MPLHHTRSNYHGLASFNVSLGQGWQEELEPSASVSGAIMTTTTTEESVDTCPRRMGHLHTGDVEILYENPDTCVKITGKFSKCDVCAVAKSRQQDHSKQADINMADPFEGNLMGLIASQTPQTPQKFKYVCKFTDHKTRWKEIYLLHSKEDAMEALHRFNLDVVIPNRHRIQRIRTDKGGEFIKGAFREMCQTIGVRLESADTAMSQQIGVSERDGRSLMEKAKCLIRDEGFPKNM